MLHSVKITGQHKALSRAPQAVCWYRTVCGFSGAAREWEEVHVPP